MTNMHPSATVVHRRAPRARHSNVLTGGGATVLVLWHGRGRAVTLPEKGIGAEKNNSPVKEEIGDVRERRRGASSGERRARRRAGDERSGGDELGTVKEKKSEEEVKETVPAPYLWGGIPERFPIFRPTISTIVGGIYFVPHATWHYPERPIRPHRGPHGPNGWIPDRVRLPGGALGGPWFRVSNSSGDQRSRFAEMVLPGRRLRLPVKTISVRRSR